MAYNVSFEDHSPLIHYHPVDAWDDTHESASLYSGFSFHATSTQGASLSFSFNGTDVWLYGARMPGYGMYTISIDGQPPVVQNVNLLLPEFQQLLGSVTGLEMGPHEVTLTQMESGSRLDFDYLVLQTGTGLQGGVVSTILDDGNSSITYNSRWTSGINPVFFNDTVHYTQSPDASVEFSFDGDMIAVYGSVGPCIGNYTINLDGVEQQFNGGSDGTVRIQHAQTPLYFASDIGFQPHHLVITANPSELGEPSLFELDAISVLATTSSPNGVNNPVPDVGSSSNIVTSSTSISTDVANPMSTPTSGFSSMSTAYSSTGISVAPTPVYQPSNNLIDVSTSATRGSLVAAAASAAVISVLAIIFLFILYWTRHRSDPPSYSRANALDSSPSGYRDLSIQDVEKHAGRDNMQFRPPLHREGSRYAPSTVYEGSTSSSAPLSIYRGSGWTGPEINIASDRSSSGRSSRSSYSSTASSSDSRLIWINHRPMPPQFTTPRKPVPSATPIRPPRPRDTLALPF